MGLEDFISEDHAVTEPPPTPPPSAQHEANQAHYAMAKAVRKTSEEL